MKNSNKFQIIAGIVVFVILVVVSIIILLPRNESTEEAFLKKYDLQDLTVEEMVATLDNRRNETDGFYSNITSTTFTVGDAENKFEFDTPKDKFYLSFAPYINNTHPCGNHNLVTCTSELQNEVFHVVIEDTSGNKIVNKNLTSMKNGFIGVWLPKNIEGTITVTYNGLSVTTDISTYNNSGTCLTEPLQLT